MATTNISERAMLVRLKRHIMYTSRRDKGVTDETTSRKGAMKDAGGWSTRFLPKDCMSTVTTAASRVKMAHEQFTLPWLGDGTRILPAQLYGRYMEKMNAAIVTFDEAADEWIRDDYPALRDSAPERLGDLMTSEIHIPTVQEARAKFSIEHNVFPMPDSRDFRCNLGGNSQKVKAATERLTKGAVSDLYRKMTRILRRYGERRPCPGLRLDGV